MVMVPWPKFQKGLLPIRGFPPHFRVGGYPLFLMGLLSCYGLKESSDEDENALTTVDGPAKSCTERMVETQ